MKRITFTVTLSFVLLLATLLCSCNETTATSIPLESDANSSLSPSPATVIIFSDSVHTKYELREIDGKWYMTFPKEEIHLNFDEEGKDLEFSSLTQMKENVLTGNFHNMYKYSLYHYHTQTPNGIAVFDPNALYLPQAGRSIKEEFCIWHGEDRYTVHFSVRYGSQGTFSILRKEAFNTITAPILQNGGIDKENLISSTMIQGEEGTHYENASCFVYHRNDENGTKQKVAKVVSKVITEEKTLYIEELFLLAENSSSFELTKDSAPFEITVYGDDHGIYFETTLTYLELMGKNRFSETELLSFGVKLLES